ncbi:SPOR domain-containing protein [Sphingomonas sp.]|jgi:Flp pilus assembly protein TadD|uniref:SPOR domain-containing protein n=1 Tax=Sphingomonas sp. TaxID=28214 RepID=UPI002DF4C3BA|nr:SPOR domain-containing protein [Sphingomonas sp.]HEV2567537.1 SPOR domain-containing protein [Sphingomonas sp.]
MDRTLFMKAAASALVIASMTAAAPPAAKHAQQAERALAKNKLGAAVEAAEAAVAASPQDARYRMLLGRAYLAAGRYQSASASFADAIALDESRGGAALSLALTRIGLGDQARARDILERHGSVIPAGDCGLALALAGDTAQGVQVLEAEVRGGAADAKTRQNLALAYALAGRWPEAKLMASYDLDPVTLSQRIMEWSRFTREQQASAQVASLLGVAPGADPGQPQRLALAPQPKVQLAEVAPPPPPPPPPVQMSAEASEPAAVVEPAPSPAAAIQFAERNEVVQQLASPVVKAALKPKAAPAPARLRPASFELPSGGRFVVQLGAFDSAGVAEAAWNRMNGRISLLRNLSPSTMTVVKGNATFHRLSVSGFATRANAVRFCEELRTRGGQCFVREAAGDAPLQWARRGGGTRLAAR